MPILSIITINYNNKHGLEKTIKSVISQTVNDIEFIIVDGGSTDGSIDIIGAYQSSISYFVSENDEGIYDAQNKGIQKASGDYLLFLNSGDTLFKDDVISGFYSFTNGKNHGIVYGNTNVIESGLPNNISCPPEKLDVYYFFKYTLNHQACFIRHDLFSKYGFYDTKYKICADFDFFFNVFYHQPEQYIYFNKTICNYEIGGLSSNKENYETVVFEKFSILKSYLPRNEYDLNYKTYRQEIPLKYRFFERIYKIPVLNWMFKKTYQIVKGDE